MNNYNFLNLSPPEFEELTRDLLQKELKNTFESFAIGPDQGIDLRYCVSQNKDIIVQCKRYKNITSLLAVLKTEVSKVKKLNPSRYIVVTSVGLSPAQKNKIQLLFKPFIKTPSDIYGRNDLNNLLNQFPEVERQHFKLWLSSTNILERILHSKIYNQSSFEEDKIKETINVYVDNDSFYKAIEIIKKKKYAIISGIPGIGKTTLARVLVFHYLANGFKEFIFLSDSIDDAYTLYKEKTKQVFLFDDFLGRNFLEKKLSTNEEQKIVKLIDRISRSKNKVLVLTTREYILAQAKQRYDIFDNPSLEFAKCVIDLSHYTKMVRAKILYNHLYFSTVSEKYIANLVNSETYKLIIQHPNYNPRIIEIITSEDVWKNIKAADFSKKFLEFLTNPASIWKHVYENQISNLSKCILANLMTAGTPILLQDLVEMVQNFAQGYSSKYGLIFSEIEFRKSIKELENTFIQTKKDSSNSFAIEYQNPSVQDFLVNYFKDNSDFICDILNSATFFNQLFRVFDYSDPFFLSGNKIILNDKQTMIVKNKLLKEYEQLSSSTLRGYREWWKTKQSDYKKFAQIISKDALLNFHELRNFIREKFELLKNPAYLESDDLSAYLDLVDEFHDDLSLDINQTFLNYVEAISTVDEANDFTRFEYIFYDEYRKFIHDNDKFKGIIKSLIKDEIKSADDESLDYTLDNILGLAKNFNIECDEEKRQIEKKIKEKESKSEDDVEGNYEPVKKEDDPETSAIKNMFESFKADSKLNSNK
jgi:hypothetical protein